MNNAMGQKTPPPSAACTVYFTLDDDGDVLAARPAPLAEVRPQPGGSAAHCGADHREIRARSGSRHSGAAAGGPCGGTLAEDRRAGACRAGYRPAHDLSGPDPAALCVSSSAEG